MLVYVTSIFVSTFCPSDLVKRGGICYDIVCLSFLRLSVALVRLVLRPSKRFKILKYASYNTIERCL